MGTQNNKNKKDRRQYSEEFKKEAVRLSQEKGTKLTAEELGISPPTLSKWRKIYLNPKAPISSEEPSYQELLKAYKKLERENQYLSDINEVLKKSTAIFSKDHMEKKK